MKNNYSVKKNFISTLRQLKMAVSFLIFVFIGAITNAQIVCGPINTLYQTIGQVDGVNKTISEVYRYNAFQQTYIKVGELQGSIYNAASNSAYNATTQLIYSSAGGTTLRVYDPANNFSYLGDINITGNTKNFNNVLFALGDYVGFVRDNKVVRIDVTGISSYPATIAVTEATITGLSISSNDYSLIGSKIYGTTGVSPNLIIINLSDNTYTTRSLTVDNSLDGVVNDSSFGASWQDRNGNYYTFNNGNGAIYKIADVVNSSSTNLVKVLLANKSGINDGFGCEIGPDPLDWDDDTIENNVDIDDDNDGILDINESPLYPGIDPAGDENGDGIYNYRDAVDPAIIGVSSFVDVNGDTINDKFDFDLDGIPNSYDLDSDNDGIPDNVEAQSTLGYIAPSDISSFADADNDGLDDVYDSNNANSSTAASIGLIALNTDGAGNADFLDVDADDDGLYDTEEAGITLTGLDTDIDGLDDATDFSIDVTDPNGTINNPTLLPDADGDYNTGGDVDYRDSSDIDNDGILDTTDLDDDNDGILDTDEYLTNNPFGDEDGDGIFNFGDVNDDNILSDSSTTDYTDSNNDGIPDAYDLDLDGIVNHLDTDSDGDGCNDANEGYGLATADGGDGPQYGTGDPLTFSGGGVNANGTVVAASYNAPVNLDSADGDTTLDFLQLNVEINSTTALVNVTVVEPISPATTTAVFTTTPTTSGSGTALKYQWEEQIDGVGAWSPISNNTIYAGANTNELTITISNLDLDTNKYRVVISSVALVCNASVTSTEALLTINELPVATNDDFSENEDTTITGNVITGDNGNGTDGDADSSTLEVSQFEVGGNTYTIPSGGSSGAQTITGVGTITIDANGDLTFNPVLDYVGSVPTITYTLTDGETVPATDTATINISVTENRSLSISANEICNNDVPYLEYTVTLVDFASSAPLTIEWLDVNDLVVKTINNAPLSGYLLWTGAAVVDATVNTDGYTDLAGLGSAGTAWPGWQYDAMNGWTTINDGLRDGMKVRFSINPTETVAVDYPPATIACASQPNLPPVTDDISEGGTEDATITITLTGNDTDVDPDDALNVIGVVDYFNLSTLPANGTLYTDASLTTLAVINTDYAATTSGTSGTLALYFVPNSNWSGSTTFDYAAIDNDALKDPTLATATINITAVNDVPVAENNDYSGNEDAGNITGNVITDNDVTYGQDSDADGDALTVNSATIDINGDSIADALTLGTATSITVGGNVIGTITLTSTGALTFSPALNYNGTVPTLNYVVTDPTGDTDDADVVITVNDINDEPVTDDVTASGLEDATSIAITLTGSDVDGTVDNFNLSSLPSNGILYTDAALTIPAVISTNYAATSEQLTLYFVPNTNWNGVTTFDYVAIDDDSLADATTAEAEITVTAVNDNPVATENTYAADEETQITGNIITNNTGDGVDSDVDSSNLTISQFEINGTTYPVTGSAVTIPEGEITILANGDLTFDPATNYFNNPGTPLTITYTLVDDGTPQGSATADVLITINNVNDPPVAGDSNIIVNEESIGTPLGLLVSDPDNPGAANVLTSVVTELPTLGVVTLANGTPVTLGQSLTETELEGLLYNAPANYNGFQDPGDFSYDLGDGIVGTPVSGTANITILAVNDAPIARDDDFTISEDTPLNGNIITNNNGNGIDADVDSATLEVTQFVVDGNTVAVTSATPGTINITEGIITIASNGNLTFVPALNYYGPVPTITYTITDGESVPETGSAEVNITVTPENDRPDADRNAITVLEESIGNVIGLAAPTDVDGDILEIEVYQLPSLGVVTYADGTPVEIYDVLTEAQLTTLLYNAPNDYDLGTTVTRFIYTVIDPIITTPVYGYTEFTIIPVNDAPIASNDDFITNEDTTINGNIITGNNGNGPDSDVDGDSMTVTEFTLNGTTYPVPPGGSTGPITVTNSAGDPAGTITVSSDGTFVFVPEPHYHGDVPTIDYEISDGNGGTDNGVISITIDAVNDAPDAKDDAFTILEDTSLINANIITNDNGSGIDSDVDPTTLEIKEYTIAGVTGVQSPGSGVLIPTVGTVTILVDGTLNFVPLPNYNGSVPLITYTLTDSDQEDTATVAITVTPVNDPPVVDVTEITVLEESVGTPLGLEAPTDVDLDVLTIRVSNLPSLGTVTLADGTPIGLNDALTELQLLGLLYNAPADVVTTETVNFLYTVWDNVTGNPIVEGRTKINIVPINDAPVAVDNIFNGNEDSTITGNIITNDSDIDSSNLTVIEYTIAGISGVQSPGSPVIMLGVGVVTILVDGSLTFVPLPNYNGPVPVINYTISDNETVEKTASANITINVNAVEDLPVVDSSAITVLEESVGTPLGLLAPTDADGDILTIRVATLPNLGEVTLANGTPVTLNQVLSEADLLGLLYNAPTNYDGVSNPGYFEYGVAHAGMLTPVYGTTTITIIPVNDAPIAENNTYSVNEDTTLTQNIITNNDATAGIDSDEESPLAALEISEFNIGGIPYSVTSGASTTATIAEGSVTIASDGTLTFVPTANYNGSVPTITYTLTDGDKNDTADVVITVNAVNDVPVAVDDIASDVVEDSGLTNIAVLGNDDFGGDGPNVGSISVTAIPASVGTAVVNDGGTPNDPTDDTIDFTPTANYNGSVTINYTIEDADGNTSTAQVNFNVTSVNDVPVAVNDIPSDVAEDSGLTNIDVLGNDSFGGDGPNVGSITVTPLPASFGTVVVNNGGTPNDPTDDTIDFTPAPNYYGPVLIEYIITDLDGNTSLGTVSFNVTSVNDVPVAVDDTPADVLEDSGLTTITVLGNDDFGGDGPNIGSISVTPILASVGIAVLNDGGTPNNPTDDTINFTPTANFNGPVSIEYTIEDIDGNTSTAEVTFNVTAVNDAPVATDDSFSGLEDANITGNVITGNNGNGMDTDLDMDALAVSQFVIGGTTYVIVSGSDNTATIPSVGTVTIASDGSLTFVPVADYNGSVPTITYTLTDGNGGIDTADVSINVTPVNDAPIADANSTSTTEDVPVTFNVTSTDTDTDGTINSASVDLDPSTPAIDSSITTAEGVWTVASNGDVTFAPVLGFVGVANASYTVNDNEGLTSNTANLTVTVNDAGNPVANDDTVTTSEDTPVTTIDVTLNDSMVDNATINPGNPVSAEGVTVINNNDGTFTYTPPTGFVGTDTFTYTICDDDVPTASCDTATVTVTVTDEGNPVAVNDTASTSEDVPVTTGNVLANDTVIDNATITAFDVTSTQGGTVTSNGDGTFEYTPATGFSGTDTFTYTLCDDDTTPSCSTATVTITVADDGDPTAVDDNVSITEDTTVATVINALSNDTLSDDATYSVGSFIYTGANGATIIDNGDGTFDYTPAAGFAGLDSFSYTICDDDAPIATCSTATVIVTVVDEGNPLAVVDNETTDMNIVITTGNVLANDTVVDNAIITTFDTTSANGGTLVSNGDGTFDYTPALNFIGVDSFNYTICDDDIPTANCSTAAILINVLAGDSDLVTTKTVSNATPNEGEVVTYTLTVTNNGPSTATSVSLTDNLPVGVTYVSHSTANGTFNNGSGVWNIGTLANAAVATLTIDASVNVGTGGQTITNIATSAEGDQSDPNPTGNIPASLIVNSEADIVLTKVVDNATPNEGDTISYTVTVTNNGAATVTNLVVTDMLPSGLTYGAVNLSAGTITGPGVWYVGSLAPGVTENIIFEVIVGAGTGGSVLTNTISNTQDQIDSNLTLDDDFETITVTSSDLVTVKTVDNATPVEGATIAYTISVTNNGPNAATGVSVTDNLPVGVTYASHSTSNGNFNYGSGVWTIGNIANGATATLTINATVNNGTGGTAITNHTNAAVGDQSDPTTTGDVLDAQITVVNGADIVLTKVVDNNTPNEGGVVVYTISVTNNSLAPVTNLVVTDLLPVGLTYGIATPSTGTWNAPNWTVGTLNPGGTDTITIEAFVGTGTLGQFLTNTVTNSQDQYDTNATSDDDSETIHVTSVDLVTLKTVSDHSPNEGELITYTIEVSNTLGGSDATNVNITDNLPVGVTYVSHSTVSGTYNQGSGLWNIGNLTNGSTATLLINATVNSGTVGLTILNVTSHATADQADVDTSNNSASVAITPVADIDLSLTKIVLNNEVNPLVGDEITFEIRVENAGPTKATGVQVTDLLPAGYSFENYSSTIGTYNPITGLWNIGTVEVGNTAVLLVDVIVLEVNDYENCAEITAANENDIDSTPNNGNNSEDDYACATVNTIAEVDLGITKTIVANNTNPLVNTEITFEIRVTNYGQITATEVEVTDLLPSGYQFVNYSATTGVFSEVTGLWNLGKILVGETETILIDVIVNAIGNFNNCASITNIHQTDSNTANNNACIATAPIAMADLSLTKEVDNIEPMAESDVNFTIEIMNDGPSSASGVQVMDLLPSGYQFVSYTSTVGTYNETTGIWNVGTIANQASERMVITATVLPTGDWLNKAQVYAANEYDVDSTPGNNDQYEDDQAEAKTMPKISLFIPEEFTPNGDGINDGFEIEHLQVLYPNFSMEIINRWGNKVYEYKHNGDPNTTPQWWDGYSDGRWNLGTGELPVGTYFYTIYFNNNERTPQTGWIYLRR